MEDNVEVTKRDWAVEFTGINMALDALTDSGISGGLAGAARAHLAVLARDLESLEEALMAIADEDFFLTWADAVACARIALGGKEQ
jgi:hypothetical protein